MMEKELNSYMLRDYQQEMLERMLHAWRKHRSVMVQMPTGTGKTHLMAEAIRREKEEVKREKLSLDLHAVLIVTHRRELIAQIRETLVAFGIDGEQHQVYVESIQKLSRELCHTARTDGAETSLTTRHFSLIIVDEAHHALAKTYRVLWELWPKAKFLGLTATPCRLNGAPFTDLFDVLLQSWSIQEFIDKGWLSDFEYVSASPESMAIRQIRQLKKRGTDGDYQTKEMATVMDVPESIAHLYETYHTFAYGKKGIVYAIDCQHAQHIATYYQQQGIRCAVIDSKTPAEERQRLVEAYKTDRGIDVLVNVDIFSEGFDCPEVEFIQLARPTLSLSKYLQQVGRGMRVSKGKPHVLILDNVGLYQTFGLPTDERDWRGTFSGKSSGRGMTGLSRYVVLEENGQEKELVNLEMVRIKQGGRRRSGLEIFLKDGRYGVMRNGRITCPATFKTIERLEKDSKFFALGKYMTLYKERYTAREELRQVTTIISRQGIDLQVKLYGDVHQEGDLFKGCKPSGWLMVWDSVGECYYDEWPDFKQVGGVDVVLTNDLSNPTNFYYKLRQNTGKVSPTFHYWGQILYNRDIVVVADYLVVKKDRNHAYRILGFLDDSIIVQSEKSYGFQQIHYNGKMGSFYSSMPPTMRKIPDIKQLRLSKAEQAK